MRKPILPGATDVDQLEKIWMLCGTPNQHTWPNYDGLPGCEGIKRFATHSRRLKQNFETFVSASVFYLCCIDLTRLAVLVQKHAIY